MPNTKTYTVAVAGATGLVGRTMLKVLEEKKFPVGDLRLLASARSEGKELAFAGKNYRVQTLRPDSFAGVDIALFSAGGGTSREFAPHAAQAGCVVIDNSSAWRMDPDVPLVVPEVNMQAAAAHKGIIANPNCSTIQLVVALAPIQRAFGLKRVVVSTYQAVSGAGEKGVAQLQREISGDTEGNTSPFAHPVAYNTVFHNIAEQDGNSEEENKMINETRKIMGIPDLKIAVTCVRIPTLGAHGEAVNIETERPASPADIRALLADAPGIVLVDEPGANRYPTILAAEGHDEVFVGRIRKDESVANGIYMWVVADNVRKGAASNAVQIAEGLCAAQN